MIGSAPPPILDRRTLELLAELVAEAIDARRASPDRWVDAGTVAAYLSVEAEWVRDNGERLGGVRLHDGEKAPWRFRLDRVDAALEQGATCPGGRESATRGASVSPRPRRRRAAIGHSDVPLLPVRGDGAA